MAPKKATAKAITPAVAKSSQQIPSEDDDAKVDPPVKLSLYDGGALKGALDDCAKQVRE